MPSFKDRVAYVIKQSGGIVKFSEETGISRRTLNNYLNNKSEPGRTNILKMAEAGGVCPSWFLNGADSMACLASPLWFNQLKESFHALIPPSELSHESLGAVQTLLEWFTSKVSEELNEIRVHQVGCVAMQPTLLPGDLMLIDTTFNEIIDDSIYMVEINGRKTARRFQTLANGNMKMICDNSEFQDELLTDDNTIDKVFGKVAGVFKCA